MCRSDRFPAAAMSLLFATSIALCVGGAVRFRDRKQTVLDFKYSLLSRGCACFSGQGRVKCFTSEVMGGPSHLMQEGRDAEGRGEASPFNKPGRERAHLSHMSMLAELHKPPVSR